ncbi:HBS1-like protein isoform X3 [Sceloporus undulatus]|uniref:HBS1-like protein isoform X3 n=1 Tax=Sceloporus undulatus TaxID=8520 RepID=UPI001C4D70FA|nr:HBS1-like protein isoform X3 [Sceloporus undulatus]
MARHRNVRGYNYDEDFEEDDLYGQSVEDDYCISPSTAAQFIYSRRDNPGGYAETLEEEEYGYEDTEHSNCISNRPLTGVEKAQLESCLDHMREVLGESVAEKVMVDAVLQSKFDVQQALDFVLSQDKQNMKTKNEDTVLTGKATKGLLCSEIFSDVNNLTNMGEHNSDCASSCFGPDDPIVGSESFCNPRDPSDEIIFRHKCVKTPSVKKKLLMSSCKSLGQLPHPLSDNNTYDESFKKQASLPLSDSGTDWKSYNECSSCFSSGVKLLKENPPEKGSCNHLKCGGVHDLKTLLRFNETGDSPDAQNIDLIVFQKKSDYDKSQATRIESDIVPKVTKMTVSGRKQTTGFEVPGMTVEENGHNIFPPQKGFSSGDANANLGAAEILSKPVLPPQTIQPLEEPIVAPTQKRSGKAKQQIDVKAELEKRQGGKHLLNLVIIGHVDAGKSTLMGHLLYLLGNVNKRTMHKYEQESKKAGKASFAYAWVLDETGEERERGVTMDVGMTKFETKTKVITLMDAPGHKDFIPNMITGAAQADVAILVVDASRGEFEAGFETGGQTREHGLLVRSLGVTQLAVAVNKMDQVNWQQERFQEIVNKLGQFLKQAGFKESDVAYIPTSGLGGENLVTRSQSSELTKWYEGKCLLEQIDSFKSPQRSVDKPFRLCVSDVFKDQGSGFCVTGKIDAGYIQVGDRLLAMPPNETCTVKGIALHDEPVDWAAAGDHVSLTLTGMDIIKINVGCIFCCPKEPIKACTRFRARVLIFNIEIPITKGFPVLLHFQTVSEPATIRKLLSVLHKSTGEVTKKKPKCLTKGQNALIELQTQRPVALELYKDFKELGRFMLRYGGSTIAAGVVAEV